MASSKFSESPIREEDYAEVEENLTVVVADSADLAFDEEAVENLIGIASLQSLYCRPAPNNAFFEILF